MAKIYTSQADEDTISLVLRKGFRAQGPKWTVLRLALALSLRQPDVPDESFDQIDQGKGSEYTLELLNGHSQKESSGFADAFCALLSVRHQTDLFKDEALYAHWLQRHIRRGLKEIQATWRESHDFHEFLFQELFSRQSAEVVPEATQESGLTQALAELGFKAEIIHQHDGPRVTRHTVRLTDAEDFGKLERRLDDLAFTLGLKDVGVFMAAAGSPKTVWLDVPRPPSAWTSRGAEALTSWQAPATGLPVLLGLDVVGDLVVRDLVEAPHLLVAGTTGSGKSVCLHSMLLSLMLTRSPQQVQWLLIDPKRVEMAAYNQAAHLHAPIVTEGPEAVRALQGMVKEMAEREKLLASRAARDWAGLGADAPPRLLVVVEELAALLAQAPEAEAPLVMLAQKARATGIHLVLATQRPDSSTFSGLLRSNIPSRIALTVQKSAESKIVLDETGAEKLLGKGDMLIKWLGTPLQRVHGLHIQLSDMPALLQRAAKKGVSTW
ncbi:DNA translocase FtsK [Polaromonas sp.]|uniref:DNA translocase FtsK n=1 Tax=Polaromonas sp. TaxID=1869339 RepID=UPI003BB7898B